MKFERERTDEILEGERLQKIADIMLKKIERAAAHPGISEGPPLTSDNEVQQTMTCIYQ